jgi:hypothetical protein
MKSKQSCSAGEDCAMMAPSRKGPGKGALALGLSVGVVFNAVGLLITLPTLGGFGFAWTLVAGGVVTFYGVHLFDSRGGMR